MIEPIIGLKPIQDFETFIEPPTFILVILNHPFVGSR